MTVATAATTNREPLPEWEARLREVSPVLDAVSYLKFRWHAGSERWILYEMVPVIANVDGKQEIIIDRDLYKALTGPNPLYLDPIICDALHQAGMSPYQWSVFQETGRYARPCWVIQGASGGHLYEFDEPTKELAKAVGLPQEPPTPGDLPYAPFDERVVRQILNMSRLMQAKNDIAELKRNSTTDAWKRHVKGKKQEARAAMVKWLEDMMDEVATHFVDAYRAGEYDEVGAPVTETDYVKKDEVETNNFIQTGSFGLSPD